MKSSEKPSIVELGIQSKHFEVTTKLEVLGLKIEAQVYHWICL